MPIEIHLVTGTTQFLSPAPSATNGWVYVKPSQPFAYNDGAVDLQVQEVVGEYPVQAGLINRPLTANKIVVIPNTGAANEPDDTYWVFVFDFSDRATYRRLYRFPVALRSDVYGDIEFGAYQAGDAIVGSLLAQVANQAARLALADSVGQIVYQQDNDTVYTQTASPATNPANWSDTTIRWSDIIVQESAAGSALTGLDAHIAAVDPHPQYLLRGESVDAPTPGTGADGLGFVPRLNPVTGYLPSSFIPAGSFPASAIPFTPTGNIAATDVQAALAEVDSEKLARDGSQEMTGVLKIKNAGTRTIEFRDGAGAAKGKIEQFFSGGAEKLRLTNLGSGEYVELQGADIPPLFSGTGGARRLLTESEVDNTTIETDGATPAKLRVKDLGITGAKIANTTITSGKLATDAVTTSKIQNGNVTKAKLDATTLTFTGNSPGPVTPFYVSTGVSPGASTPITAWLDNDAGASLALNIFGFRLVGGIWQVELNQFLAGFYAYNLKVLFLA